MSTGMSGNILYVNLVVPIDSHLSVPVSESGNNQTVMSAC